MAANTIFQPVNEHGWRRGLMNLLRHENGQWWRTRRWFIHTVVWLVLVNGVLAAILWAPKTEPGSQPATEGESGLTIENDSFEDPNVVGTFMFVLVGGLVTGIGAVLVMQGAIIDEKKSGTAAWIMSKPVSRSAFILSRLIANGFSALLVMIVFQGAVVYLQLAARSGNPLPLLPYITGLGVMGLHLLFYLSLTLMLGTLFNERGPVIGIPIAVLMGAQFLRGIFPWLVPVMPWQIILPEGEVSLGMLVMFGQPLPTITPIIATAIWTVIFLSVAIWRFNREEF